MPDVPDVANVPDKTHEFLDDLLTRDTLEQLLEQAQEDVKALKEGLPLDALALTIGCHLGRQQGIDIYEVACQVISIEDGLEGTRLPAKSRSAIDATTL